MGRKEYKEQKVQVLLSSYNGEKYIQEQINSILEQNIEVQLLIRDDGSTDTTPQILAEYEKKYTNIKVYYEKNIGVIASFFHLMQLADETYSYFAFADQDDVWLPEKLSRAIMKLEQEKQPESPMAYCSEKKLVDKNLNVLSKKRCYNQVKAEFGNALVENICTGCTCVINRSLLLLLKNQSPRFMIMHDFWIYLVGTCFGTVLYDETSYILYRQHGQNNIGETHSRIKKYRNRIKNFKRNRKKLTEQAFCFWETYQAILPKEKEQLLLEFVATRKDKAIRKKLIKEKTIFRQRREDTFIMRILLFFGLL